MSDLIKQGTAEMAMECLAQLVDKHGQRRETVALEYVNGEIERLRAELTKLQQRESDLISEWPGTDRIGCVSRVPDGYAVMGKYNYGPSHPTHKAAVFAAAGIKEPEA